MTEHVDTEGSVPETTDKLRARWARREALLECAGHLEQTWTDDPIEIAEGNILARQFYKRAETIRRLINAELAERPESAEVKTGSRVANL